MGDDGHGAGGQGGEGPGGEGPGGEGIVELTVPAQTSYLDVVRTATAGLAARSSFTFDEIEDLRTAVDAACVMLLSLPGPRVSPEAATVTCRFEVADDAISVDVSARVDEAAAMPAEHSIAWQVLTAHVTGVSRQLGGGQARVRLIKQRRP
jgi:serine/threonine-protein kinase RsbW